MKTVLNPIRALTPFAMALLAAVAWARIWPVLQRDFDGVPLLEAHREMVRRAQGVLPFHPEGSPA